MLRFVTGSDIHIEAAPWGARADMCGADLTGAERLSLVRVEMPPGRGHAFHRHPALEEILYMISGEAEQWVGRESRVLKAGELAHIPQNVVHATYNTGHEPLVFLAILSPARFTGPAAIDVSAEAPWRSLGPFVAEAREPARSTPGPRA